MDSHIDSLAVTHLDLMVGEQWNVCTRYKWPERVGYGPLVFTPKWKQEHEREITDLMWDVKAVCDVYGRGSEELLKAISDLLKLPVSIRSRGRTHEDKTFVMDILRPSIRRSHDR